MEKIGEMPELLTKFLKNSSPPCQHGRDVLDETSTGEGQACTLKGPCPACEEERAQLVLKRQLQDAQNAVKGLRRQRGVPERYLCASLSDFREETPAQKRVGELVRAFVDGNWQRCPGLLFLGNVGTGKTFMGSALVNHWLEYWGSVSARYYTMLELVRRVRASWSSESFENESMAYQRLSDVPLLVIDEIGVQFGSPAEKTIFSAIIDRRYNALHPTILIGNLTLDECADVLGERVMDRFRDGGLALAFTWPSQRGAKQSA